MKPKSIAELQSAEVACKDRRHLNASAVILRAELHHQRQNALREHGRQLVALYAYRNYDPWEIGDILLERVNSLKWSMWEQVSGESMSQAGIDHKQVVVPYTVGLLLSRHPTDSHVSITTDDGTSWGLYSNDIYGTHAIDDPEGLTHAQLHDDCDTLERLHEALGFELPPIPDATSVHYLRAVASAANQDGSATENAVAGIC